MKRIVKEDRRERKYPKPSKYITHNSFLLGVWDGNEMPSKHVRMEQNTEGKTEQKKKKEKKRS